ncbi:nucleotidyl transferase AbiEii/AbiGii toxin family protein [Marinomonas balearica]|uniref:Putative nucleotidyltransferase n=1 Tax=Marinomonas balearica TaxID=491947 RepID=A0A4R6MHP7_9GAMM|nr:nucleotidyl transferase AbiEii/AbiGii toxin family protein [Marinomonas balearica]TDP01284.1 putative nucleotidyltransferase [Marinomonas balearica]
MKSIYTLKHPLNPAFETVLEVIISVTSRLGIPYFIAGATARDLLLYHVFDRDPGRKTHDIDTAILVSNWDDFTSVKNALLEEPELNDTKLPHRLMHKESRLPVDIIPFGSIADNAGEIQWPPEHAITMSVAGFQEAFDHSVLIDIGKGINLKVSSLAGFVLLKLLAWQERKLETSKDIADFLTILTEYPNVEFDRLYEDFIPAERLNYNIERQGAFLLGYDLNMLLLHPNTSSKTLSQLIELKTTQTELLISSLLRIRSPHLPDQIEQLLGDFWDGVNLEHS